MFWFLLLGLLLVIGGVTLAVVRSGVGEGDDRVSGGLTDPVPERLAPGLPEERPLVRGDVDALRLPLGLRGYRMEEVDDVLDRLGAELSERDARIAELEAALAGNQAAALGRPDLFASPGEQAEEAERPADDEPTGAKPPFVHDELSDWDSAPTGDRTGGQAANHHPAESAQGTPGVREGGGPEDPNSRTTRNDEGDGAR